MGYSKDRRGFTRVKSYLDQMLESSTTISWEFEDSGSAAWAIRNGIEICIKSEEEDLIKYRVLKERFKITIKGSTVSAVPRGGSKLSGRLLNFEAGDTFQVVQEMITRVTAPCVVFPLVSTIDIIIENWCKDNNYTPSINENNQLVLTKK